MLFFSPSSTLELNCGDDYNGRTIIDGSIFALQKRERDQKKIAMLQNKYPWVPTNTSLLIFRDHPPLHFGGVGMGSLSPSISRQFHPNRPTFGQKSQYEVSLLITALASSVHPKKPTLPRPSLKLFKGGGGAQSGGAIKDLRSFQSDGRRRTEEDI